jgi:hypothetical protein
MPPLSASLQAGVSEALKLAEVGEVARFEAATGTDTRRDFTVARLEYVYELSFLRMFYLWEDFLEQAFLRYACGYQSTIGVATLAAGRSPEPTLAAAQFAAAAGRRYALWHSPSGVIRRSQKFFSSCPIESVVQSNLAQLERLAAVRHRIVHAQADARVNFDAAAMAIAGRRYPAGKPGALLRDSLAGSPGSRYIESFAREFQGMAAQIA